MNPHKIFLDITNKKFTDCVITFIDNQDTTTILECHKLILATESDYFDMLFSSVDKNQKEYIIKTHNAKIARDILLSFYDQKFEYQSINDWQQILDTFKCRNYFLLDNNIDKLYDLIVPNHGFPLLLDVISELNIMENPRLILVIKNNMPQDYDINMFSTQIKKIFEIKFLTITAVTTKSMIKWELNNRKHVYTHYFNDKKTGKMIASKDGYGCLTLPRIISQDGSIMVDYNFKKIILIKINTNEHICTLIPRKVCKGKDSKDCQDFIEISNNNQFIATYYNYSNEFKIWNANDGNCIKQIFDEADLSFLSFSNDCQYVVTSNDMGHIKFWNIVNEDIHIIKTIICRDIPIRFVISNDNQLIVLLFVHYIEIWNIDGEKLINRINKSFENLISISNNNKFIVTSNESVKLWNTISGELIWHKSFDSNDDDNEAYDLPYTLSPDDKFVAVFLDNKIIILDTENGNQVGDQISCDGNVHQVIFSYLY